MDFSHTPVLLSETIDSLHIRPDGIYCDGTIGGGGHSGHILSRLSSGGRLIGFDQDEEALAAARQHLASYHDQLTLIHSNYADMPEVLDDLGIDRVDGILLDLGVSSYQLDNGSRGFSYRVDAPLDMRMDQSQSLTARDIVNTYSKEDLYRIIRDYGEDRHASAIAANIVKARQVRPIETTFELVDIIDRSYPARDRRNRHPAKQTFQALRIECNSELAVLKKCLDTMVDRLNPGGRFCIITFQSLEDRIVKNAFRKFENPCTCPPDFPVCVCGAVPKGRVITRKPVTATQEELQSNHRSHSAKLRVFEHN